MLVTLNTEVTNRSRVTEKLVFTVTYTFFIFLSAILNPDRAHKPAKNHRLPISPFSPMTVFTGLALWRHHISIVTSREREILVLWRHICRLFLHAQIGAKAIFASHDNRAWISIFCHPVFTALRVRKLHPHYNNVIMGAIASQISSLTIVYSIVYSDADQRKHQSSASLAFVWGMDRWIPRINGQ